MNKHKRNEPSFTWEQWGSYFGFPECCIKNFRKHAKKKPWWYEDKKLYPNKRILAETGFIPCPICNIKHSAETMINLINSQRICSQPFPADVKYSVAVKEMESYLKSLNEN